MRPIYLVVGLLCVGIATVNLFIPGAPSTVFVLISLWCFKRSSPRLEHWLLYKSIFGPVLRDWDADRSMTRHNKIVALTMLWLGIGGSIALLVYRGRPLWVSGILLACAVGVTIFIASVKTKREEGKEKEGKSKKEG